MIATPRTDANTFSTYDGFSTKAPVIRVVKREVCAEIEGELTTLKAQLAECEKDSETISALRADLIETQKALLRSDSFVNNGHLISADGFFAVLKKAFADLSAMRKEAHK